MRATKDVDIVIPPEPENMGRVADVVVGVNGRVHQEEALLGTPIPIGSALASGEQVAIETDLGRLDVVQGLEGVPGYEELQSRAVKADLLGVTVSICSIKDLKATREAAATYRRHVIALTGRYLNRVGRLADRPTTHRPRGS